MPVVGGATVKNIIHQLVRVFEVKRLTTNRLHDVRRLQLHIGYVPAVNRSDHPHGDHLQRALTRRLVHDFNSEGGTRGVSLRADEKQFTDVQHFEKYLRCKSLSLYQLLFLSKFIQCRVEYNNHCKTSGKEVP